jgi:hypothetical protein
MNWLLRLFTLGLLALLPWVSARSEDRTPAKISWKKTVVDTAFRAEGVGIGDINKDGKMDITNGDVWYENPTWKMHEIRPTKDLRDGDKNIYSQSFMVWTEDLNSDGWLDVIVIGFPGAPCHWYENPQNKTGHWKQHVIWHSACNETVLYTDLLGNGKRVIIMGFQPKGKETEGQMAYFTPAKDPTQLWEMHPISVPSTPAVKDGPGAKPAVEIPGTRKFYHGLGVGDVNGDGRNDVLIPDGWWEQPAKVTNDPWKFHPTKMGDSCADMYAVDLDGDKKNDIICSSAHGYGIWSFLQKPGKEPNEPSFLKQDLFPKLVSQTHAMHFKDINGDGLKDIITGKRWWAHGPKGDADPNGPAKIFWLEAKKSSDGLLTFTPHEIDDDSGIGTQFVVDDFNGDKLLDVVVSNKKGVFLIEQVRK